MTSTRSRGDSKPGETKRKPVRLSSVDGCEVLYQETFGALCQGMLGLKSFWPIAGEQKETKKPWNDSITSVTTKKQ